MMPDVVRFAIETGDEQTKVELKEELNLNNRDHKARLVKSVAAIANSPGDAGYIVIGVVDARHRDPASPAGYIKGGQVTDSDSFQLQVQQILDYFIDPPVVIGYQRTEWLETALAVGIIEVPISNLRPHVIKNDIGDVRAGNVYIRHGRQCVLASRQEIVDMCGDHWRMLYEEEIQRLSDQLGEQSETLVTLRLIGAEMTRRLYQRLRRIDEQRARIILKGVLRQFGRADLFDEWIGGES